MSRQIVSHARCRSANVTPAAHTEARDTLAQRRVRLRSVTSQHLAVAFPRRRRRDSVSPRTRRCKIRARGNGERNAAARIFRSSCSRSLEIASGHYGRLFLLISPLLPVSGPTPLSPSLDLSPFASVFVVSSPCTSSLYPTPLFPVLRSLSVSIRPFRPRLFLSVCPRLYPPPSPLLEPGFAGMRRGSGVAVVPH